MKQLVATCWTCLLLFAFLCEPVLSKGGRGGARGSSRGHSSRSSSGGHYRGGNNGGTRSRFRAAGRSSPVRVAAAAAAGAAVALTADGWYASASRRRNDDSSEYSDGDYFNRTNYFASLTSGSTQNESSLTQVFSVVIATFFPKYGYVLESIF